MNDSAKATLESIKILVDNLLEDNNKEEWVNPLKPSPPELRGTGGPLHPNKKGFLKWLIG